ncbi:MAG: PD-(D/E)XK nuclease family protein [Vicinamibacterales bacterium]
MHDPFIDQLKGLCRDYPTRAKWVFVPTRSLGRTIGDRLAREGGGWVNLRFVTPLDIALRMGAPFLVERGIDPSEEGLGPALVMRLLLQLPEDGGYFRPLATQPQLASALWSMLREIRMAGLSSADLPAEAFVSRDKHTELVALAQAYEQFLIEHRRGDRATVYTEALAHPDWCPIQAHDCWTEVPDVLWAPLERRLLATILPASRRPGLLRDPVSRGASTHNQPNFTDRSGQDAPRRPGLLRDPVSSSCSFFQAGGAEAEIEEVFRRILASGRRLDEAEIVCATPSYATLIWEKAIRHDWPVTVAHGVPVAMTRPGRALLSLADWIDDDFAAGRLRRMLQSGDIRPGAALAVSSARAARLLVRAQAAWGRETYRLAFARLSASSRRRAERDDLPSDQREGLKTRAAEADALGAWITALVEAVPQNDAVQRTVALADVVACARGFVDSCAATASALDHLAAAALIASLDQLAALGDFRCPLDQALRFIAGRVADLAVGSDRPRPGHLHVSSLDTAGYAGRPLTFIVGLEEGRVFPAPFEDPILLDRERAAIGAELKQSTTRTDEAVAAGLRRVAAIIAAPDTAVSFSYSSRDVRQYRQTYASWLMLHAWRVATGRPTATYQELHAALGAPKSCVPAASDVALDPSRWWLRGAMRAGDAARAAVCDRYPFMAGGESAAAAREASTFSAFDGHVPAAGPKLDPCRDDLVISPTQLEDAASCPFRHFLRRGLGVEAIESGERDRDVWLDPLLRGSLLHDLYAGLLRRCRAGGRRVSVAEDLDWMQAEGQSTLSRLAIEMPPPSAEVADRESQLFLGDLAIFVTAEAELDPAHTPIGFEIGFGRGGSDDQDDEPLAQEMPVFIDLGDGLKLRIAGRIDRIDQVGPSRFEIIDYKTGGYWKDSWQGIFAGGARLQHALYGLAAMELLRRITPTPTVVSAQYYFPSAKGGQERKHIPMQSRAKIAEVLADLRRVISKGVFIHAANAEACRFCDYGYACGLRAHQKALGKQGDPELGPFLQLGSHE